MILLKCVEVCVLSKAVFDYVEEDGASDVVDEAPSVVGEKETSDVVDEAPHWLANRKLQTLSTSKLH